MFTFCILKYGFWNLKMYKNPSEPCLPLCIKQNGLQWLGSLKVQQPKSVSRSGQASLNHQQGDVCASRFPCSNGPSNFRNDPVEVWSKVLKYFEILPYSSLAFITSKSEKFRCEYTHLIIEVHFIYRAFLTLRIATDHTAMSAPVLVWSLKLSMARLG